ncbi:MAG TPA: hypothetical protein VHT96_16800 [Clostridia bacterium]|nr:hypothetical protein [Clostridia bacterium]
MALKVLGTLNSILEELPWPEDFFSVDGLLGDFLDKIYVLDYHYSMADGTFTLDFTLAFEQELSVSIPGVDAIKFVFMGSQTGYTVVKAVINLGKSNSLTIQDASFALRFGREYLKPVDANLDVKESGYAEISVSGSITVDAAMGISIDGFDSISLSPCMIADTGFIIAAEEVMFDFSRDSTQPEIMAIVDDPAFMGIYMRNFTLKLPKDLCDLTLELSDCAIGNKGFYGTISAETNDLEVNIYDFDIKLKSLSLSFKHNTLIESSLAGSLKMPFYENEVDVNIGIAPDNSYILGLSVQNGVELTKPDVMTAIVRSLTLGYKDEAGFVELSGSIKPLLWQQVIEWPEFVLEGLSIDTKGRVKIQGGWINFPKQLSLDFHGFSAYISKIGFGSIQGPKDEKWVGFSGGMKIVEGIPLGGSVEGMKIIWSKDGDVRFSLDGIGINFEISNVLKFDGAVAFYDRVDGKEFRGSVALVIYPIKTSIDVNFVAGNHTAAPSYNYFYVAVDAQLPVGIPLLQSGLAIFGAGLLFGYNMAPTKGRNGNPDETWYEWYSSEPKGITKVGGTAGTREKWSKKLDDLAFGAGLIIGTYPDNGYNFSAKCLLAILIPGPVIIFNGKVNISKERALLNDDSKKPLFNLLAIYDNRVCQLMMNLEGFYMYPEDSGSVVNVTGMAEAFFDFLDTDRWYFNVGREEKEKRVRANILDLFEANAYLMLDSKRFKTGCWIGYDKNWKFGPVSVVLSAWMDGYLFINWKPIQAEGGLTLCGEIAISVASFKARLYAKALVEAKTPKPFLVFAGIDIVIELPWPLPDVEEHAELKWEKVDEPPVPVPLAKIGLEHLKVTEKWELLKFPTYDQDNDGFFDGNTPGFIESESYLNSLEPVPVDVNPVITFSKAVRDDTGLLKNVSPYSGPESAGKFMFDYSLKAIKLYKKKASQDNWEQVEWGERSCFGTWQLATGASGPINTKLMLGNVTPFEGYRENKAGPKLQESYFNAWETVVTDLKPKECNIGFEKYMPDQTIGASFVTPDGTIFISPYCILVKQCRDSKDNLTNALYFDSTSVYVPERIKTVDYSTMNKQIIKNPYKIEDVSFLFARTGSIPKEVEVEDRNGGSVMLCSSSCIFVNQADRLHINIYHSLEFTANAYSKNSLLTSFTGNAGQHGVWQLTEFTLYGDKIDRVEFTVKESYTVYLCKAEVRFPEKVPETTGSVRIIFPEEIHMLKVYTFGRTVLKAGAKGIDGKDVFAGAIDADTSLVEETLAITADVQTLELSGDGFLCGISYITKSRYEAYTEAMSLQDEITNEFDMAWGKGEMEIFEPETFYKIEVETRTERSGKIFDFKEAAFFRTGNPPGLADQNTAPSDIDEKPRFPWAGMLCGLKPYIRDTVPVDGTKTHYCFYDVGITYNSTYVDMMYVKQQAPLFIKLYDNNGEPVSSIFGEQAGFLNLWGDSPEVYLTREEELTMTFVNKYGDGEPRPIFKRMDKTLAANGVCLKSQTMYFARLCAIKEGKEYDVFGFSFITSRFSTFVHHIQSFKNLVWGRGSYMQSGLLLDASKKPVIEGVLASSVNNTGAEAEAAVFSSICSALGIVNRGVIESVELTSINNEIGEPVGLLLESPEPLDNDRVTMEAFRVSQNVGHLGPIDIFEVRSDIKITGFSNAYTENGELDVNQEWIEIIALADVDLKGLNIGYKDYKLQGGMIWVIEDGDYKEYCTITESFAVPKGTVVRIHTGSKVSDANASNEQVHYYLGKSQYVFGAKSAFVCIRNAEGRELHKRHCTGSQVSSRLDTVIIRSMDQTGMFIFFPQGSEKAAVMDTGKYRLEFEFKRNIGLGKPRLMRMGSDEKEKTDIEFNV